MTTSGQLRILDLACGKGGDLGKWIRHKPALYTGIDVAQQSLKDLTERILAASNWKGVPITLVAGDLSKADEILESAPLTWTNNDKRWRRDKEVGEQLSNSQFDVASMQFALHYMASSKDTMRSILSFIASKLRPGGQFIATTVDARVVCETLMGHTVKTNGGTQRESSLKDKKGRELLKLIFPGDILTNLLRRNANVMSETSFGIMYYFILAENEHVEDFAVKSPEWLLPLPELVKLADDVGLDFVKAENFHELYQNCTSGKVLRRCPIIITYLYTLIKHTIFKCIHLNNICVAHIKSSRVTY